MNNPNLLWNTVNVNYNVAKLLKSRECSENDGKILQKNCQFTASFLKRLNLDYKLEGHQGCVNCLQWSADGRILASGSDDTHVRIWDPFVNSCLHLVPTKHIGNIFSVKFVGDGSLIATGAGDCRVIVQSIEDSERQAHIDCSCHRGRVKRLATAPDQSSIFWSASEDGFVLQYDLREQHECMNSTVFVDLSYITELKCITVNPTKPHLIAVGANDSYVRLYDRRMIKTSKIKNHSYDAAHKRLPPELQDPNCVQYYAPGHLAKDNGGEHSFKLAATYVTFDSTGNDLLVNMGGEHIYLFNINNQRHINEIRIPECLPRSQKVSPLKPCCLLENHKNEKRNHEHNYQFNTSDPCACDYIDRATKIYKRKWIGDVYFAARDYLYVIQHWPENEHAYLGLIECLIFLKWFEEATDWLNHFRSKFTQFVDRRQTKKLEEALAMNKYSSDKKECEEVLAVLNVSEEEKSLRMNSIDYEMRYIGHCNTTTDIKEANFLGDDANFICAGSDDGMIFIWDTKTTNLLTALEGDDSIVNCVQPHPTICYLASSGIDPVVKIWSPKLEEQLNYSTKHRDPWSALRENQDRMRINPFETMLLNMGYRMRESHIDYNNSNIQTCRTS